MLKSIKDIYKNAQFSSSLLGLFLNPFYITRVGLISNFKDLIPRLSGRLLDVGCGSKPYKDFKYL